MSLKLPALNQPAPAFSAPDQHGNIVTLDSLRGRNVVLYFYPKAMTPGCTVQACGIRDHHAEFAALNTLVLGISPDAPQRLQKFIERDQLNLDLRSLEGHASAHPDDARPLKKVMGQEYEGIHRITFIIDAQGVLRHIIEKVKTKTHHDETLALVKTL